MGVSSLLLATALYPRFVRADPAVRTIALGSHPASIAVDESAGRAFVADSADNTVRVLDLRTGAILRTVSGDGAPSEIAMDERRGHVFVSDAAAFGVSIFDTRTGRKAFDVATVGQQPSYLALDERTARAFVLCQGDGTVSVLDAATGVALASRGIGVPTGIGLDPRAGHVFIAGNGLTAVATMLDAATGKILRTVSLGPAPFFAPPGNTVAVDARTGRAFVVDARDGSVYLLDTRSGRVVRRVQLGRAAPPLAAAMPPLVVNTRARRVFVGGSGRVSILDAGSGRVLGIVSLGGNPTAMAVDERRGRVVVADQTVRWDLAAGRFVATDTGHVVVLDARNGAILQTIAVGVSPRAVAIDTIRGRIFVANAGGLLRPPDAWGWLPAWARRLLPFPSQPPRVVPGGISVIDAAG